MLKILWYGEILENQTFSENPHEVKILKFWIKIDNFLWKNVW